MTRNYNETSFTPEDVEKGMHLDLIKYLLDYNSKAEKRFNDIHITSDGYCTIVEWVESNFEERDQKFEFVDYDQQVMTECLLPDNSTVMCYSRKECDEVLEEWLKDNPTYKQNSYGIWYDERDCISFEDFNKKTTDEVVDNISNGILND